MQVESLPENYKYGDKTPQPVDEFPTKIEESIAYIVQKAGYLNYNIRNNTQSISTNGGNYLADLYAVDIEGNTKDGDKLLNLFFKIIKGEDNHALLPIKDLYQTELFVYKELAVILADLQEDANIPSHERYKTVTCYEGSTNQVIVLDNLSKKGYITPYRMDVITLQFAEMAIKELAKFHSLSFALQEKRPEYFNENLKTIKNQVLRKNTWPGFVESMYHVLMKHVDEDVKSKVEKTYFKASDKYLQFLDDESSRVCLCHGDYRPNNIMTKITNNKVTSIIPVDYQLIFYGSPVYDFIYFIFNSTDREFRKNHLTHLKTLYHDTMKVFLEYFNMDVELVYPKKMFKEDLKQWLDFGLLIGYVILPFMLASEDDVPDIAQEVTGLSFEVDDTYKDRLRGIIEDFIDWGYL